MKRIFILLPLLCLYFSGYSQQANYELAEKFTYDNFKQASKTSLSIYPEYINDGDKFWFSFVTEEGRKYYIVDPIKKEKRELFKPARLLSQISERTRKAYDTKDLSLQNVKFNDEITSFTFEFENNKYRYNIKNEKVEYLDTVPRKVWGESWQYYSPDSNHIVFAKNNNLYVVGNKNKGRDTTERQLTFDGEKYFSYAKEEADTFRTASVAVWLKDSKRVYALRVDKRKLKEMAVIDVLENPKPKLKTYKYAMPGDEELGKPIITVIDIETGTEKIMNTDHWPGQYMSVLYASKSADKIYIERRNRAFNRQQVCMVDINTGNVQTLIDELDLPFMDYKMSNIMFLNDGEDIIYRSERTGWGHYYLYDNKGIFKHAITSGEWVAGPVAEIDSVGRNIYFYALGKDENIDLYYYTLCRVNVDNPKSLKQLTFENATHTVNFSKSFNYFVDTYNRVDMIPRIVLKNKNGEEILELAKPDLSRAFEMGWNFPERFKVKAADGTTDLYGVMWKPFDFDPEKKYPIISSVYPGPFYEYVPTQFSLLHDDNTRLAQLGFIVIAVGHRGGTPMRGKFYHTYSSGKLRDYPLADDKYVIEQLADRYSFIDAKKVGIYGHSGGGFMSTAAICTYPDFYKAAVSSAGNHDNNIYNHWWAETHHGVKEEVKVIKDSINGDTTKSTFKFSVQTNMQLAKNYKGGLLLIHGWKDNNVHPAHTLRMANALIEANKNFDMIILPSDNHGFGGAANKYYERNMWYHFAKFLLNDDRADFYYNIDQYKSSHD